MYIVQVEMSAVAIEPFDCESHLESTKSLSMAIELQWHSHIQENSKRQLAWQLSCEWLYSPFW